MKSHERAEGSLVGIALSFKWLSWTCTHTLTSLLSPCAPSSSFLFLTECKVPRSSLYNVGFYPRSSQPRISITDVGWGIRTRNSIRLGHGGACLYFQHSESRGRFCKFEWGQSVLHSEFQYNQDCYTEKPCLKQKQKQKGKEKDATWGLSEQSSLCLPSPGGIT